MTRSRVAQLAETPPERPRPTAAHRVPAAVHWDLPTTAAHRGPPPVGGWPGRSREAVDEHLERSNTEPALIVLAGQVQALVDAGTPRHLIAHVLTGELALEEVTR